MVKGRLALCRKKLGDGVTLVAVIKGVPLALVKEAVDAGVEDIGESRIQEALLKFDEINEYARKRGRRLRWHMIGHLQTNKVKEAVKMFDLIQSVDTVRLASRIDRQAARIGKVQDVLLEVKTSPEATKFGFPPEETVNAVKEIASLKNISVKGLMTIAPVGENPGQARPYFRKMKELRDKIAWPASSAFCTVGILSMGMTDDFEVAIEEGATMVRLGRAVFGGTNK